MHDDRRGFYHRDGPDPGASGGGANAGTEVSKKAGVTTHNRAGPSDLGTTGRARGACTGSAVTAGTGQAKSEQLDASQRVK
jgi:hypothetical protein